MPGTVIQATNLKQLSNLHGTFRHSIDNLFNIANGNTGRIVPDYNATTKALQQFLGEAASKNKTLRCLGSNWSWTPIGYADDWILHTKRLNILKRILPEETDPGYGFEPDRVVFAQCGCTIQELSRELRRLNRSLKTSGASNGQTIAGATATGTHGSAIDVGATPDFVVGIHLIVGPNRHIYLERSSYPVVSPLFVQKIEAELVRDDALFNAALVAFGSFGIIHGMMLETEALYLLQTYRLRLELDQVAPLAESLDFDTHPLLPFGGERPFHFQFLVNPHDLHNGVYVSAMYKRPYREGYTRIVRDFSKAGPGEDAPAFLGRLTHSLPVVTALVVNNLIKNAYAPYNDQWGTLNEIFSNTDTQGRVLSAAVGIPAEKVNEVNNLLLDLHDRQGPFVGVYAYRFVKNTEATLGFTRFNRTCIAEFDSVESPGTRTFYEAIWQTLEASGIPYTFHWGKINNLDAARVRKMYGAACDQWMEARTNLLPQDMRKIFTNSSLTHYGLDAPRGPVA